MSIWEKLSNKDDGRDADYLGAVQEIGSNVSSFWSKLKVFFLIGLVISFLFSIFQYFEMKGDNLNEDGYVVPYLQDKQKITVIPHNQKSDDFLILDYLFDGKVYFFYLVHPKTYASLRCSRTVEKRDAFKDILLFRCSGKATDQYNQNYYNFSKHDIDKLDIYLDKEENLIIFNDLKYRVLDYILYPKKEKKQSIFRTYILKEIESKALLKCDQKYSKNSKFECKYFYGKKNGMYNDVFKVDNNVFYRE